MKIRSFASILANMQGGVKSKPGESFTLPKEISEEIIRKAWGDIPSAVAFEDAVLEFKPGDPGFLRITIHWTAT